MNLSSKRIESLRTPESCFENLPNYNFLAHYIYDLPGYADLRIHYLDEGPINAEKVALCLHGEPTWSYLYRKMIPEFVKSGYRVIAPDFYGFGKSDKPVDDNVYTIEFHRNSILRLIERLDLRNITLVCQDWGGLIGLTLPMEHPTRFNSLLVMNTGFGTGEGVTQGFKAWRQFVKNNPDIDITKLMKRSVKHLTAEECRAYSAPFPDKRYKAGVRKFPLLVPDKPDAEGAEIGRKARSWFTDTWSGTTFMVIGAEDPVLGVGPMKHLRNNIRHCPEPLILENAGHFVQEYSEDFMEQALDFFKRHHDITAKL